MQTPLALFNAPITHSLAHSLSHSLRFEELLSDDTLYCLLFISWEYLICFAIVYFLFCGSIPIDLTEYFAAFLLCMFSIMCLFASLHAFYVPKPAAC